MYNNNCHFFTSAKCRIMLYDYKSNEDNLIWPLLKAKMALASNFKLVIVYFFGIYCGLYLEMEFNRYHGNHMTLYSKACSLVRGYTATMEPSIKLEDDSTTHDGEFFSLKNTTITLYTRVM